MCTLRVIMMLCAVGIMTWICHSDAYTISYYNCDSPTVTSRYSIKTMCAQSDYIEGNVTSEWDLLQKIDYSEVAGYSCELRDSRFYLYCGSFSHTKFEKIPDIEITQSVSVNQCRQ